MKSSELIDIARALKAAEELSEEWKLHKELADYEANAWKVEHRSLPVLHLEDLTGIPFLDGVKGIGEYQHRARVRAGDGDLFAAATLPAEGYEDYNQQRLGIGAPDFVRAEGDDPMAVTLACLEEAAFAKLQGRARESGGLVIHPYMAIEAVWELARALSSSVGEPVAVLGPPPPALWVANDKSRFSRLVEDVLGRDWIVETERSTDPEVLARALGDLASRCEQVGIKRTRCASAMGNLVLDANELRRESAGELRARVDRFLKRTRWCDGEEVLIVEWRDTDISPSTQLWVPPVGQGPPKIDGVYEQLLDGPEKVFLGSTPSTLPDAVNQALLEASVQVCTALQQLGYVGRCSFDFIVTGDLEGDFHAQFTECNGRWGGTSTPMHLVDRIVNYQGERPAYMATDYFLPDSHRGMGFADVLEALEPELYSPQTGDGRFILYNVGPLDEHGKFDVISLGEDSDDARRGIDEVLRERLGL